MEGGGGMPDTRRDKLVVAVSSTALFNLTEAEQVFRDEGLCAYRAFQRARERQALSPGVAYPLVSRLLALNRPFPGPTAPVEVVLLSRNDPDSGMRVLHSIAEHGLALSRAAFVNGRDPFRYARGLDASLFLSTHQEDVRAALRAGVPAGRVGSGSVDDDGDNELRIAFDFDGVLADDASEAVFQRRGLDAFHQMEERHADEPLGVGPLASFCGRLSAIQRRMAACGPGDWPAIRTAIVTSRGAPAHTRVLTTLRAWGLSVDEAYFLGGLPKSPVVAALRPHIFFDDQLQHIEDVCLTAPCAHVPFGVANRVVPLDDTVGRRLH
jgi:5'-nucleotidase